MTDKEPTIEMKVVYDGGEATYKGRISDGIADQILQIFVRRNNLTGAKK